MIIKFINHVNGYPALSILCLDNCFMNTCTVHPLTTILRQQGRMNVYNSFRVSLYNLQWNFPQNPASTIKEMPASCSSGRYPSPLKNFSFSISNTGIDLSFAISMTATPGFIANQQRNKYSFRTGKIIHYFLALLPVPEANIASLIFSKV